MTDSSGYAKPLALPAGLDALRLLRYDVTAHAITRGDFGADVRGIECRPDPHRAASAGAFVPGAATAVSGSP